MNGGESPDERGLMLWKRVRMRLDEQARKLGQKRSRALVSMCFGACGNHCITVFIKLMSYVFVRADHNATVNEESRPYGGEFCDCEIYVLIDSCKNN